VVLKRALHKNLNGIMKNIDDLLKPIFEGKKPKQKKRKVMTSGHGKMKRRELSENQRSELLSKGRTHIKLNGKKHELEMSQTYGMGAYYYVYKRSDTGKWSIRDPAKDRRRIAEHESADQEKKPFQGDLF